MALQIEIVSVTPFRQNCCLIWDDITKEAVITDLGGDTDHVLNIIAEKKLKLKEIWLTHGHLDHIAGIPDLLKHNSIPIYGPDKRDLFLFESLYETTLSYSELGFKATPSFLPDYWLQEGEFVTVGNYTFEIFHIPGHTPGHIVFHNKATNLLIAGDVLFYETIGRTDFPRSSQNDLIENIQKKLFILPNETKVIAGHGRTTTIAHEKENNPFFI